MAIEILDSRLVVHHLNIVIFTKIRWRQQVDYWQKLIMVFKNWSEECLWGMNRAMWFRVNKNSEDSHHYCRGWIF